MASASDGVSVTVNPEKPRKGCFEVKVGDDIVVGTCVCMRVYLVGRRFILQQQAASTIYER